MKENLKLFSAVVMLVGVIVVVGSILVKNFKKEFNRVSTVEKQAHPDFNLPDFQPNDCFLVSKAGESLHPHYIKILNKDMVMKNYEVLEVIGNGKTKEVDIRINYYDEMKSFANYRESCPKFEVK